MTKTEPLSFSVSPRMLKRRRFLSWVVFLSVLLLSPGSMADHSAPALNSTAPPPPDALALLAFKAKADLSNGLGFSSNDSVHYCQWRGVTCSKTKVVRLVLQSLDLGGFFAADTLTRLDQLRVLSLQNNSLTGPIPDLSQLVNLKSLFLDHNSFTGSFPPSIRSLHRIRTIDLSYNNLTCNIPSWLTKLDRIYYLRLEQNGFNGTVPAFNQTSLQTLDISGNDLTGAIPVTPTLQRFGATSFSSNPGLCGEILHKECRPFPPFFGSTPAAVGASPPAVALGQSAEAHGFRWADQPRNKHKRNIVIIGFSSAVLVLLGSVLFFLMAVRKQRNGKESTAAMVSDATAAAQAEAMMQIEEEMNEKVKKVQGIQVAKSGNLVFCAGETQLYTLDQLMRGSAELLGRGTMGSTYKAVLDNRLIVCVKRLDAVRLAGTDKIMFERHLESVGGLRHPNLVPLRAYFQAKEERLLVYDYQPNGSLSSLIHGSRSTRAKPLHWTSCLKIAEDVAQGLSYIHQAWRLVHGNLKSSNVLLGADFEACVSDYCLSVLAGALSDRDDSNSNAYRAPEIRSSGNSATAKSDVYSFGVLLLELVTGKSPARHPCFSASDMMKWVRSVREDNDSEESRMKMLVEVALVCSLTSPEQRPTMWQVMKMLQEIKDTALRDDVEMDSHHQMS